MAMAMHQKLTNITIIVANNLQQICNQTNKMTANTTLDFIKQAICALWQLQLIPLLQKWHQKWPIDTNSTAKTLKLITYASWDFLVGLFNQARLLWHARDEHMHIHQWFQEPTSYFKADYMQQKWNEMNEEYKLTDTAGDIFSQFKSAGENFYGYLIRVYHDDQIRHWVYVAGRYLIAVYVLIICICCFFVLLSWIVFIFCSLFMFIFSVVKACLQGVCSIFRFLFSRIFSIVKACFHSVRTIFWFFMRCLRFEGKSSVKMMKAPGRPGKMIARAVFADNPQAYFANRRGRR